ncbi:alpha-ketoglutarate-dependent dioxygenase AlkB family protein [Olleya sp. Bg11-27]|uniref:alpha-ketoglutarate-dependent dioxygenase AlkB family protein n=1 Tax=Olleya sp. Bg11-27 TaxID=2058135 RepID=UPI000C307B35|nr:alpha-ketoglutarate-dependent dioxygenase AlkB [Olleya sp. Bg11-27]AUC75569.1 alpha-ketoglutarate-dependent dioxygenase AlkB [Olleya sp. Bg11-27]
MLFSEEIKLNLPDAEISYFPNFFNLEEANTYFDLLLNDIPWQQDDITVFGKTYAQPRLTALFGHNGNPYSYSNIIMHPRGFTSALSEIKKKIDDQTETTFTTCLANLYRDGQDSNGWHSDNEKTLGTNPIIASITFGGARYFNLKHKDNKDLKHKLLLEHGSLLLMKGTTQHHWLHQIAKTRQEVKSRINLTFRIIK